MTSVRHYRRQTYRFQLTYLAGVTGVHCADAIFHLSEPCTNTTVRGLVLILVRRLGGEN